jgi:hypothetical protein
MLNRNQIFRKITVMMWTKIQNTPMAFAARAKYRADTRRLFHNLDHIENLYWAADTVYGFSYDLNLDRAILTHDIIYDERPLKELRSAQWLLDNCMVDGIEVAFNHIMKTANPRVGKDNRMILLDFARLRHEEYILEDREKLQQEALYLTGASEEAFTRANMAYFESIVSNFAEEHLKDLPSWERNAFREIRAGMIFSIEYSRIVLERIATQQKVFS